MNRTSTVLLQDSTGKEHRADLACDFNAESGEARIVLSHPSLQGLEATGRTPFYALCTLRQRLHQQGWWIRVAGARVDAYPSESWQDESSPWKVFIARPGEPRDPQVNCKDLLEEVEADHLGTVEDQFAYYLLCLRAFAPVPYRGLVCEVIRDSVTYEFVRLLDMALHEGEQAAAQGTPVEHWNLLRPHLETWRTWALCSHLPPASQGQSLGLAESGLHFGPLTDILFAIERFYQLRMDSVEEGYWAPPSQGESGLAGGSGSF